MVGTRKPTKFILLSQFDFLETVPYVEELRQTDDSDCFICSEPYSMLHREWNLKGTHDFPVRLPCGHVVGLQCLTYWMLSSEISNRCGICCAIIPLRPHNEGDIYSSAAVNSLRLIISLNVEMSRSIREDIRLALINLLAIDPQLRFSELKRKRAMMLFEDFLDHIDRRTPPKIELRRSSQRLQATPELSSPLAWAFGFFGLNLVYRRTVLAGIVRDVCFCVGAVTLVSWVVALCDYCSLWAKIGYALHGIYSFVGRGLMVIDQYAVLFALGISGVVLMYLAATVDMDEAGEFLWNELR